MAAQILDPDDATCSTIHNEVSPLVDKCDIIERCFWKYGGQRQNPDKDYAADRKWVLF